MSMWLGWAFLLAASIGSAAAAEGAADFCRTGLFLHPDHLDRVRAGMDDPRWNDYLQSVQGKIPGLLKREPVPYGGSSARAFLNEGRSDMMNAIDLAHHSVASGPADGRAAGVKAAQILAAWARGTLADGKLKVVVPLASGDRGDYAGVGLFVGLMALAATHVYQIVSCQGLLDAAADEALRAWFRAMAGAITEGHRRWEASGYFGGQIANNHLSFHNVALFALGVALDDASLRDWSVSGAANPRNFRRMLALTIFDGREAVTDPHDRAGSVPQRGEIYDRYRMSDKNNGLYYAFFHLLGLAVLAEAAANQGLDLYAMTGENGESLADALLYYGEFLARAKCSTDAPPPVEKGPVGYEYYRGAKVEAHFWTWIQPLLERYRGRPEVKTLAERIAATACAIPPAPYLPIPTLFLPR